MQTERAFGHHAINAQTLAFCPVQSSENIDQALILTIN